MSNLGKFKPAPRKVTLPIWVAFYLGLLGFASILALVALAQPILWLAGTVTAGNAVLVAAVTLMLAVIVFGAAKLVDKLAP
jgi:hypothetical protein